MTDIPAQVVLSATGSTAFEIASAQPIRGSSGVATGEVVRVSGHVFAEGNRRPFTLIRKTVRPLSSGRHAEAARRPDHWAYWRREPLAYETRLPPRGPGLRSPRCYGVYGDTVYLEDVAGTRESPERAARHLGQWQSSAHPPAVAWLAGHQLEQRIAVSQLDWSVVDADSRMARIWNVRRSLLDELAAVPRVLSHGDFSLGNLIAHGHDSVALDWATVGLAPVGADLAHLALSALCDPSAAYLAGAANVFTDEAVLLGYQTTLALTGASRVHWMLSRQIEVPQRYVDFVWAQRPPMLRRTVG